MPSGNGDGPAGLRVGIVGAGFGGVGMAIKLKQHGYEEITVFERGDSVGGVWRANTYPGAACDVPSHLYSFSFAPGHNWSRRYAPQDEILDYLTEVSARFGVDPHLRLNTEVREASFDADEGRWSVTTDAGDTHEFDVLVTACGQLSDPAIPGIQGIDEFAGHAFHSAEWDHDHDLRGRHVAVIGTGASAIQFVPAIAPVAERVTIYQRSAPWILPKSDREYPAWERRVFERFPIRVAAARMGMFAFFETFTYGFTGKRWMMAPFRAVADSTRKRELADPELRAAATPDYEMGCKRVLITADWYSTLKRPNVELLNGRVERITADGVVGPDGVERRSDTIIYGTGFQSHNFVAPMRVRGRDGRELNEVWADAPEAYLGTVISGFPNLFVLYGPNTNHGSGSVPFTLECQYRYVVDAMRRLRASGSRFIDLRPEVLAEWRDEIARRSERTVWRSGGCDSWYLNAARQNTNNWPGPWLEFRRRTRRIDPAQFEFAS
jgi:cation diffusion facilitator CzcD-associated flavoprotein CzcO